MAKNNSGIENVGLSEVSQADRKNWPSIAFIWAGGVCCVPALMVGAGITAGLPFGQGVLAMFLGYAICVALMVLMSNSPRTRASPPLWPPPAPSAR